MSLRPSRADSSGLFRTHVAGRTDRQSRGRQTLFASVYRLSDAEVSQHGTTPVEQDVFGFDVPVDDPTLVGIGEGSENIARDSNGLIKRELLLASQPIAQRPAVDEGHDVPRLAGCIARIKQRQYMRVSQLGGQVDFAEEPLRANCRGHFRMKNLQGDATPMAEVVREVHLRHGAAAELALDHISASQSIGERRDR